MARTSSPTKNKRKTALLKKGAVKKAVAKKMKKSVVSKKSAVKAVKVKKKVLAIPAGYHSITPYLILNQAAKGIEFYKAAFGAKEVFSMKTPDGKISHAELKIGDSKIMLGDECPEMQACSPQKFGGSPISIHLYVKNVDVVVQKAVAAGAKLTRPVTDMFYGDRSGMLVDPYGHMWCVSTHIEDVTPAKLKKRAAEFMKQKMAE